MFKFPEPDRTAEIEADKLAKAKAVAWVRFNDLLPQITATIEPPDRNILSPLEIRQSVTEAYGAFAGSAQFIPDPNVALSIGELLWSFYPLLAADELLSPILALRSELEIAAIDRAEREALNGSQLWLQDALSCPNCGGKWKDLKARIDAHSGKMWLHCGCRAEFQIMGSLRIAA